MFELNIKCESADEARIYINGPQYLNLLEDIYNAVRASQKHGDGDLDKVLEMFLPDISRAIDHSEGAY
jgi:hypothetical protein